MRVCRRNQNTNTHTHTQKQIQKWGGGGKLPFSDRCFERFVVLSLNSAVHHIYTIQFCSEKCGDHTIGPPLLKVWWGGEGMAEAPGPSLKSVCL